MSVIFSELVNDKERLIKKNEKAEDRIGELMKENEDSSENTDSSADHEEIVKKLKEEVHL